MLPEKNKWSISHGKQKICAGGPYTNWYSEAQTDCKLATGSYSITCCDTRSKEGWTGGYVRIDGSNQKLCAKFNWNAGKECYTQKFDVVAPTPKPTPVPTPKPTPKPAVGFEKCTGDNWCPQANTNQQYTRCLRAEENGKVCINPEIRYGSVIGGWPMVNGANTAGKFNWWCVQLGFGSRASTNYATRWCDTGALFSCNRYDENGMHWCDWFAGYWRNKRTRAACGNKHYITRRTATRCRTSTPA